MYTRVSQILIMKTFFSIAVLLLGFVQAAFGAARFTLIEGQPQSIASLNKILDEERKSFITQNAPMPSGYGLPKPVRAANEVDVYRVEYDSVIPELGNRPTKAYGVVAVPRVKQSALPFLSYQHGTVFGKKEVPSYAFLTEDQTRYDNSYETRLAVAEFGGNGYVVMSADLFGLGDSSEPEGYMVKGSYQQACLDLYLAVKEWLSTQKGITQRELFLTGWSQGGFSTLAFLERLEQQGIPVTAASTAAAPTDVFAYFMLTIYQKPPLAAMWLNTLFALSSWSYENYYSRPGLVAEVFKPDYVEAMKKIYTRDYSSAEEFGQLILYLSDNGKLDIQKLLKPEYANNPEAFAATQLGTIARQTENFRWYFKTKTRMYYGGQDEVVSKQLARIASDYQKYFKNNGVLRVIPTPKANHRGTYLTASSKQLPWFNSLLRP